MGLNTSLNVAFDSADFGGNAMIVYDAQGAPFSGGTVVISHTGTTRTLTVDAATGWLEGP